MNRLSSLLVTTIVLTLLAAKANAGTYSGGSGSDVDPYQISRIEDWRELIASPADWGKQFVLINNIDFGGINLTPVAPDINPDNFPYIDGPINIEAFDGPPFTGAFNGNGHVLRNAVICLPASDYLGLFGCLSGGQIRNLGVINISITGDRVCGGLVGSNRGTITSSFATGSVTSAVRAGGLAGENYGGTITSSFAIGAVNGGGYIGGLVGYNYSGTITSSYATGSGNGSGLVGVNERGTITACYATGSVSGGGLVGSSGYYFVREQWIWPWVEDLTLVKSSFWDQETSGQVYSSGGRGLTSAQMKMMFVFQGAGWSLYDWVIDEGQDYPRLAWQNTPGSPILPSVPLIGSGTQENPYQIQTPADFALLSWYVSVLDKQHVVLMTDLDMSGVLLYPIGDLNLGPFTGTFNGNGHVIRNATINQPIGNAIGLFGSHGGSITHLGVENINITGNDTVGGLVGSNGGTITSSYAKSSVTGENNVGSLVGNNSGTITSSYATGSVTGIDSAIGGLCGGNSGTISDCYATCSGNGSGLVGVNERGTITACYATGSVSGGGLVGSSGYNIWLDGVGPWEWFEDTTLVKSSFWDQETSGQVSSSGGEGKTTAQMQNINTFLLAGWDFWGVPPLGVLPEGLVFIPGGTFQMGNSAFPDEGNSDELPVHTVTLDSFYMSTCEVTNGQYVIFLNATYPSQLKVVDGMVYASSDTPNSYPYCDTSTASNSQIDFSNNSFSVRIKGGRDMSNNPMICVSWHGAVAFCNWRSQQEGKQPCYDLSTWTCDFTKKGYRLPTEAEWEYAARGGVSGKRFPWGNTINQDLANYKGDEFLEYDDSSKGYHPIWSQEGIPPYTSPVGSFPANGYGLYDMVGNVYDWCNDWYVDSYYNSSPPTNPTGPTTGRYRTLRGGAWYDIASYCRVAHRTSYCHPSICLDGLGFRVALGTPGFWKMPKGAYPVLSWQNTPPDVDVGNDLLLKYPATQIQLAGQIQDDGWPLPVTLTLVWSMVSGPGAVVFEPRATVGSPTAVLSVPGVYVLRLTASDGYLEAFDELTITFTRTYSGGNGSEADPYQISSVEDWQELMNTSADWDKSFILTADIDLDGVILTPVETFTGIFDGNGHVLRNAVINMLGSDYVGLFGYIDSGGQVKNLGMINASIQGQDYVGGLVGSNAGRITSSYATGFVSGSIAVGGLVGENRGMITSSYAAGSVTLDEWVGGLVGWNNGGTISNCFATGAVRGWLEVGGLVGLNRGMITFCYTVGTVSGNERVGGLCGFNDGTVTACFWDIQTSGLSTSAGGTGLTTAQMQTLFTFIDAGWDFVNETQNGTFDIWVMLTNNYPSLSWQIHNDCNGNGIPDSIDISQGTSRDCNGNGVPDKCDIAKGTSRDLNGDMIPDECQVDVRVEPVVVLIDPAGTSEVRTQLPESISAVVQGGRYYVEIWASDLGVVNTGLTGVYVDVGFCGQAQATELNNGTIFTEFASGTIQLDKVDEFGGSALPSGGGVQPEWVRIGWLTMNADIDTEACRVELQPSSTGIATLQRGLVNWAFVQLGSKAIQIFPPGRSYDLDSDTTIGVGDLSLFAGSWQKSVPPALPAHDFDCDNFVGVGDLSWFATGWLKATNDPTILYPACTPPPAAKMPPSPSNTLGMIPPPPAMDDILYGLALRESASSKDTAMNLPDSVDEIVPGATYSLEVWASDVGDINTGLISAYVDLEITPEVVTITNVGHGGIFTQFKGGTVGQTGIDNLGGSTLSQGLGVEPAWARVAEVKMTVLSRQVSLALTPSSWGTAAYGRGTIPWNKIALGSLEYVSFRPWDLNGDSRIDLADFAVLSENWLRVGDQLPGDFDKSRSVTIEDLAAFVNHWLEE